MFPTLNRHFYVSEILIQLTHIMEGPDGDALRTDLSQDFLQVTRTFEHLGQRLTDVAEQIRTLGVLPSEDVIDAITLTRRNFQDLRAKAIKLVGLLGRVTMTQTLAP